ncbi:MAG TPA: MarR family transcriptional regulator [Acidimicrobiia bacterium]|jgi:DNA-binding MarR family transcriptional regulator
MGHHDEPLWRRAATSTLHISLILKADLEELLQQETGLLLADNEALINLEFQPMRMSEIAESLVLSRGGTTKVIDRLEELGHVTRRQDPDDRRATLVEITESGRQARADARAVVDRRLEQLWSRHISDDEAGTIVEVMERVLDASHGAKP